jgi:hypothetical protein
MKKLTKSQRHTAYIILLSGFESGFMWPFNDGFCYAIQKELELTDKNGRFHNVIKEYFPELQKYKPKIIRSIVGLWFETGSKKRIEILNKCIQETY